MVIPTKAKTPMTNVPIILPVTEQQARELAVLRHGPLRRIAQGYLIDGPLNVDHLRRAMSTVIAQHTALRTAVITNGEVYAQVVLPEVETPLFELAGAPRELTVTGLLNFVDNQLGAELIRLNHAPLWWLALARTGPNSHVLVGACSRLVVDFVSISVMFRWFLSSYLRQGRMASPTVRSQYLNYSRAQDQWRKARLKSWVDTWDRHVDFRTTVSSRGTFPNPERPTEEHMTDMFELPEETMTRAREVARRHGCEVMHVMVAALLCLEREATGNAVHRILYSCNGRTAAEERAIGAYQVNGLVALETATTDSLETVLSRLLCAWNFMKENLGIGIESLLDELAARSYPKTIPVPFRISVHAGGPPQRLEIPAGPSVKIHILPGLDAPAAPLDSYTQVSVMFVSGRDRDAVMLSWWRGDPEESFFSGLWQSYPQTLARLLAET